MVKLENFLEEVAIAVLGAILGWLVLILYGIAALTIPLWIVPFLIYKRIKK